MHAPGRFTADAVLVEEAAASAAALQDQARSLAQLVSVFDVGHGVAGAARHATRPASIGRSLTVRANTSMRADVGRIDEEEDAIA